MLGRLWWLMGAMTGGAARQESQWFYGLLLAMPLLNDNDEL